MALSAEQKRQCVSEILTADSGPFNVSRPNMSDAVDAIDAWATTNAASFNNALPAAAKSGLSATQKNLLLAAVLRRRAGL